MRDTAIDAVKGICIVSMVVAHVSNDSVIHSLIHSPLWIDGAFGFVFLAGLVLGIVQRRKAERKGAPDYQALLRRSRLLYVIQFSILGLALVVRSLLGRPAELPSADGVGGWLHAAWLAATLQLPAPNLDVLPMYVVLLLAAVAGVLALHKGKAKTLLCVSAAVYLLAFLFPKYTVMPYLAADPWVEFNWAAWQLPFVGALILGWYWSEKDIARKLKSTPALVAAAAVYAGLFLAAQVFDRLKVAEVTPLGAGIDMAFRKFDLGPGTIVFGLATLTLGYLIMTKALTWQMLAPLTGFLETLGKKSLDSFVILCLAVILAPALFTYRESGPVGMMLAAAVLLAAWGWAKVRLSRKPTKARTLEPANS